MERVISEILYLERTQNLPLETILHTVLSKYNITPKKNELITADDSWHTEVMDYLKRQTIKGLRPKTIEQYKDILVRAFESIGKPVREITASDILLYLAYLKNMRGTSARYMNGIRVVLNGFFSWCFKSKITDTNPVDGVDRIKYVKLRLSHSPKKRLRSFGYHAKRPGIRSVTEQSLSCYIRPDSGAAKL